MITVCPSGTDLKIRLKQRIDINLFNIIAVRRYLNHSSFIINHSSERLFRQTDKCIFKGFFIIRSRRLHLNFSLFTIHFTKKHFRILSIVRFNALRRPSTLCQKLYIVKFLNICYNKRDMRKNNNI